MQNLNQQFTVYFVDDEPSICQMVRDILSELFYRVVTFTRAEECLVEITKSKCDLLITDINLPGMNGIELLEEVKKLRANLPVLMITGRGDIREAVHAMKAGAIDFLEKPLDMETFIPLVTSILEQNAQQSKYDIAGLTNTEKRVLQMIVDGKSNKEIAWIWKCSVRTIENHRYRLMRKMKTENMASLIKTAIVSGLAQ